jgi:hypothetical protein
MNTENSEHATANEIETYREYEGYKYSVIVENNNANRIEWKPLISYEDAEGRSIETLAPVTNIDPSEDPLLANE